MHLRLKIEDYVIFFILTNLFKLIFEKENIYNIPDWHAQCIDLVKIRIKEASVHEKKDVAEEIEEDLENYLRKRIKKEMQDDKWPCIFCDKVLLFLFQINFFEDVPRGTVCVQAFQE